MNYSLLRNKVETNKLGVVGLFKKLNISNSNFYYWLSNGTLKISILEKICTELEISPAIFFEEKTPEQKQSDCEKELLQALRENARLNKIISTLQTKNQYALVNELPAEYKKPIKHKP